MKYIICVVYLLFSILGVTFIKMGNKEAGKVLFQIVNFKFTIQSIIGYSCYIVSFILYTIVISKFDLSYIYPIIAGVSNVIILIIAVLLFQEKATAFSLIGSIFIVIGVALINIK